ncbi:hypothetical protein Hamer_G019659 [Homarus americanus]|uniref:Uncharacterized protein n=1 Tax=Homarus americanus TaxID=6706 RepID=A0A8J5K001_HOMAM|nr:hypothetical protein Hamer_G019659 [Homarus americanus]
MVFHRRKPPSWGPKMDLRRARPKGETGATANPVRTSPSALYMLAALVEAQQLQAKEERAVMQQQQQASEEVAGADRTAMQALIVQVLQLLGETATIASTVSNVAFGDPNTGTPDAFMHPQARHPHAPVPHKLSPDVTMWEFKVWRSAWSNYEELLQMRNQPHWTQLAHLSLTIRQRTERDSESGLVELVPAQKTHCVNQTPRCVDMSVFPCHLRL